MKKDTSDGDSESPSQPFQISLRCFVENPGNSFRSFDKYPINASSSVVLVFDTETTADEYQNLLFGSCGIWKNGEQVKFYMFYADDLPRKDVKTIIQYCKNKGHDSLSRTDFVNNVFLPKVLTERAKCVAFNIPFDISRIALRFSKPQRAKKFQNGFTFKISEEIGSPYIRIKSLNSKASFVEFTKPSHKEESRQKRPRYKGYFLDLKTFTFVLTNESYTLARALEDFGCSPKSKAKEHGIINPEYLDYNVNDTMVTYELYEKATERYQQYMLSNEPNLFYSPASIGKAYLEKIGINSFFEKNPKFPKELLGYLMMTYYGGRTEVRIRKQPEKASYVDFTSMYPSVFVLLEMYDFLVSEKIEYRHAKQETQEFLNSITISDINKKETWKQFTAICRIVPDDDILPVRSRYHKDSAGTNIGINYLKSTDGTSLWYTLPDLVASKLLSGKTPVIEDAITFSPKGKQKNLKGIEILKGIHLKPGEDFIKKLIEERLRIKDEIEEKEKDESYKGSSEAKADDVRQDILKIIANATSYGIFIQINSSNEDEDGKNSAKIYGLDSFETEVGRQETPGKYFNPIMSVFLTACSRLLLAAAESIVLQNKGKLMYCDTDSIFISPEQVEKIQDFFNPLNPYDVKDLEMFKIEKAKKTKIKLHDRWFYGISAKRYVLYDRNPKQQKEFTIHKHSAHGLGHILGINEVKIWESILNLEYHPEKEDDIVSNYENDFSISSIGISSYNVLERFRQLNSSAESYDKMIKPFNFATIGTGYRLNEDKNPIIPFLSSTDKEDRADVPYKSFIDYKTGKIYSVTNNGELDTQFYWKPLSKVLKDYITHEESKFEGDRGELKRKHVVISKKSIAYVGKETNELDRAEATGILEGDETQYLDYKKILLRLSPSKDCEKLGVTKRYIIKLQKKCKEDGSLKLTSTMKEKIRKYQMQEQVS